MADEQEELVSIKNDGALLSALSGPLANPYSGMGVAGRDRSVSTQIAPAILLGRRELADAYAGDWLCRRVVDSIADDATKSPPELKLGGNEGGLKRANKVISLVSQALADLDVCGVFREAAMLERLYGGAAIILGLDDGQEPDQPVNENALRAVRWLRVLDRWHITGIGVDQSEPDLYMLSVGNGEQRLPDAPDAGTVMVHPSRVLRLNGEYLPSDLRRQNRGWGASVLQRMIASWRAYRTATAASAAMVDGWDLFTHRIAGLSQLIASGREDDIRRRLEANSLGRSVWKSMLLDESEEVGWINRSVAGVDSILEKLREDVQGATGFDQTTLFGVSAKGLGNTGRLEERNFARRVTQYQRNHLTAQLKELTRLVMISREGPTGGREPDVWDIAWPSSFETYPEETAALREAVARTDNIYVTAGVLRPEEVAQARFGGAQWSAETTLSRDNGAPPQIEAAAQANVIAAITAVSAGQIPVDSGVQLVMRLLGVSEQEATAIVASAGEDVEEPEEPMAPGQQPDTEDPETEDPEDPTDQTQTQDHADAVEPMKVRGRPLSQRELNKLAEISAADIEQAIADWNTSAPALVKGMLEATSDE